MIMRHCALGRSGTNTRKYCIHEEWNLITDGNNRLPNALSHAPIISVIIIQGYARLGRQTPFNDTP